MSMSTTSQESYCSLDLIIVITLILEDTKIAFMLFSYNKPVSQFGEF